MITLHQYGLSPYNEKIFRMLNYKGLDYQVLEYPLAQRKKILAFNPTGKLPAIEHNGKMVCDSTDAAHYLEQEFPDKPLIPADSKHRGMVHVLEDWADESLYFYEMRLRFGLPANGEKNISRMLANEKGLGKWIMTRVIPGGLQKILHNQGVGRKPVEQLITDVERHIAAIDGLLGADDWLINQQISLADLAVYSMLQAFADAPEAVQIMDRYPAVGAWMQRVVTTTGESVPAKIVD